MNDTLVMGIFMIGVLLKLFAKTLNDPSEHGRENVSAGDIGSFLKMTVTGNEFPSSNIGLNSLWVRLLLMR